MALSKAHTVRMIGTIDLIGMTLVLDKDCGNNTSPVAGSMISLLGAIRAELAKSYHLTVDPIDSLSGDIFKKHLSPAEAADLLLEEMNEEIA